jgi:hypothetical protein
MYNGTSFNIFEGNPTLYGYYMSFHFQWYVECHISPSQLERYGHEKLENPGFGNGPNFV